MILLLPGWESPVAPNLQKLILALQAAKKRQRPVRPEERQPGTGTNESGPQVQTNYPANAWPEDGDHS